MNRFVGGVRHLSAQPSSPVPGYVDEGSPIAGGRTVEARAKADEDMEWERWKREMVL